MRPRICRPTSTPVNDFPVKATLHPADDARADTQYAPRHPKKEKPGADGRIVRRAKLMENSDFRSKPKNRATVACILSVNAV